MTWESAVALVAMAFTMVTGEQIGYSWSFEERTAKADLIVIAEPLVTKDTGRRTVHPSLRPDLPVIELETEFKVFSTLKGQSDAVLRLKHFRVDVDELTRRTGSPGLVNTGTELSFAVGQAGRASNLLFLTETEVGHTNRCPVIRSRPRQSFFSAIRTLASAVKGFGSTPPAPTISNHCMDDPRITRSASLGLRLGA